MKAAGILLGGFALMLLGSSLSARLREQLQLLLAVKQLFLRIDRELAVRRLPTGQLLRVLAESADFQQFSFLREVSVRFDGRKPLEEVWADALERDRRVRVMPEMAALLRECGGILGSSDWETQTAALTLLTERLDGLIAAARERAEREGRMYRSLGLLSGILLAILAL